MTNPLLADWNTPFGIAPFDRISDDDFAPALEEALTAHRAEIDAIAENPAAPSFANTIEALEASGDALDKVLSVFFTVAGADSNGAREALQRDFSPKLAAHQSAISGNTKLFARIAAIWEARDTLDLTEEQARVLMLTHRGFVRSGAALTGAAAERMKEIKARLAVLGCHILLEEGDGPAIIFDIGGGSTELVLVQPGDKVPRIVDWLSVPWGVVSLTDTVQGSDASEASRLERYSGMRQTVSASFAEFAERIRKHTQSREPIRLLGTSGTVTTLASLHLELPQYDRRAVDGLIVPSQAMRDISTRLSRMSAGDRKCLPCIGDDRANLVIAGCAILESILDIWPAEQLGVADRGIREGILRSLIAADAEGERSRAALQRMREQDV